MTQRVPAQPIDLAERRGAPAPADRDALVAELQSEIIRIKRVRDGEARRLEGRIAELERLLPELWRRGTRIDELSNELQGERRARMAAEETAEIFREEIELLREALHAEQTRTARLSGSGDPVAPADPYRVWERRFRERLTAQEGDETRRLRDRVARQLAALQEKEARITELVSLLAAIDPEPDDEPDDLTRISGVGPAIAGILHEHNITSFDALAALDADALTRLGEAMPVYPRRIFDDAWVDQARALAEERDERRRRHGHREVPR